MGKARMFDVRMLWKLQGSTLLYTLSICLLIGTLLGSLVLLSGYARLESDYLYHEELAQDNLDSGINALLYGKGDKFGSFHQSLFDSQIDSFHAESRLWGIYGAAAATGVHGPARTSTEFLFGIRSEGIFEASLYLQDRNRPLTLAGDTRLEGELYLPKKGLKRGIVGRKGFTGKHLYQGVKRNSGENSYHPDLSEISATAKKLEYHWNYGFRGSSDLMAGDSIERSWFDETIEIESMGRIFLTNVTLKGNIAITAPEIWVGQGARLDNILLFAKSIYFEDGFEGRLQAFATDTLETGEDCRFAYPSVLLVSNPVEEGLLKMRKGTEIEGCVINKALFAGERGRTRGYTLLDEETRVYGNVFVSRNLDIKSKVIGNVYTGGFILQTPSGVYENHLLDATITRKGLSKDFAMGLLIPDARDYIFIDRIRK